MGKIFNAIFPLVANYKANKLLKAKMCPINEFGEAKEFLGVLENVENSYKLSSEMLKEQYEYTLIVKDKLEDKAKTIIIGITISISLIIGASGMLSSISQKYQMSCMSWVSFILLTIAIAYMISSGLLVIRVLLNENEVYIVKLNSLANGGELLREDYDMCIAQNQTKNIIRNNYVFTSYVCIRNSLVCLFTILLLITIPFNALSKDTGNKLTHSMQEYSFAFTSPAIDYLKKHDVRDTVENVIVKAINESEPNTCTGVFGIVDVNSSLFIKCEVLEENIKILLIEPYISNYS